MFERVQCGTDRSAATSDELDSRATRNSHRDVSGHERRRQQQQQQQREEFVISDSKTSSGDRRSTAVQRLVDLQHQSKHLSRLLAAKKQVNRPTTDTYHDVGGGGAVAFQCSHISFQLIISGQIYIGRVTDVSERLSCSHNLFYPSAI